MDRNQTHAAGHTHRARSPPARVAWIETGTIMGGRGTMTVATREGGVDRNIMVDDPDIALNASPPARVAWIETINSRLAYVFASGSPPARVAWIET